MLIRKKIRNIKMNDIGCVFEIGDYVKNPNGGRQESPDRYLVVEDAEGKTAAYRLPKKAETEESTNEKKEKTAGLCGSCTFFSSDQYIRSSVCSIRKIQHPTEPGIYLKKPNEKGCKNYTERKTGGTENG